MKRFERRKRHNSYTAASITMNELKASEENHSETGTDGHEDMTHLTAKQRRKLRRQQERSQQQRKQKQPLDDTKNSALKAVTNENRIGGK